MTLSFKVCFSAFIDTVQRDIVLAFHPPSDAYGGKLRALTEFASA
ncbi:hypothetical protein [Nostoc sp.]